MDSITSFIRKQVNNKIVIILGGDNIETIVCELLVVFIIALMLDLSR